MSTIAVILIDTDAPDDAGTGAAVRPGMMSFPSAAARRAVRIITES